MGERGWQREGKEMDQGNAGQLAISASCREECGFNSTKKHNFVLFGLDVEQALQAKAVNLGVLFH